MVYDDLADKPLRLSLDKVHRARLSKIDDGLYFVCADFKTPEGLVYDLDFWMRGTRKEELRVTDVIAVHKEDGKRRYYWSLNAESNLWEQKPITADEKSM